MTTHVVGHGLILLTPCTGPAIKAAFLRAVVTVFDDFGFVREICDDPHDALEFVATVDGLQINGCDFLTYGADSKIVDFTVMVRPLRATQAFQVRMAPKIGAIMAAAAAQPGQGRLDAGVLDRSLVGRRSHTVEATHFRWSVV